MKGKNVLKLVSMILVLSLTVAIMASCTGVTDLVSFKVDFIVDGEVYKTISTSGNEIISLPSNPTKEGYVFKGWYWDNETWQQPFTANSLLNAPLSGDMKIYAKFENIENAVVSAAPVPGTAYKLFIDQENAGKRCYVDGTVSGYYLGVVSDITKSANVYVEESGIPGRFYMYCVKDGARNYINIVKVGEYYNAVYNNAPITAYTFNTTLKTMVATVDGFELMLGTNSAVDYERIGTRFTNEPSFIAHFAISSTPDSEIPDATVDQATVGELVAGLLGKYKTTGTVVAINAQSFLIGDGTGYMLVYKGASWTPDVKIGDTLEVEGNTTKYGNAVQFEKESVYTITGSETFEYPNEKTLTGSDADAYASLSNIIPEYVKISGTIEISGNYCNLIINGAAITGSITYPMNDLSAFNGKTVEVEGFVTGVINGGRYLNLLATNITEVTGTDGPGTDGPGTGEIPELYTIAEIIAKGEGDYSVVADVVGVNAQSFLVSDGTACMLVYRGAGWTCDVKVGDIVDIFGTVSKYGGAYQFGAGAATYEVVGNEPITYPTPIELTADMIAEYSGTDPILPEYVKVKGTLAISGNYYNLTIDGATLIGSITYPTDDLTAFDGKEIEVEGFVTGVTGSGKYLNILTLHITEVTGTDGPGTDDPGTDTPEFSTLFEIISAGEGDYSTTATVVGVNAQSFLISDGTAYMLVYRGADWNCDVKVGDVVELDGTVSIYGGAYQFGAGAAVYEVVSEAPYNYPAPKELDAQTIAKYAEIVPLVPEYVKVKGTLNISGNYYNLLIDGATLTGSIAYPADDLSAFNGKEIEVEGFVTGITGSGRYLNLLAIKISEIDTPDDGEVLDTPEKIINAAYALAEGETLKGKHTLEGVVIRVDQSYNPTYGNVTITIQIGDMEEYPIKCYRLSGEGADVVKIGDTVAVSGFISNFNGTIEFIEGCSIDSYKPTDEEPEYIKSTISDVFSNPIGTPYEVNGTVVGINAQSFLIMDETGYVLVYQGAEWIPDVKIGETVNVKGTSKKFGTCVQFDATAKYEVTGKTEFDYPNPLVPDSTTLDAFSGALIIEPVYVNVRGTLVISSGKYYNIIFDGATIQGSFAYPIDDISSYEGKVIDIKGFVTGTTTNGSYLTLMVTEYSEYIEEEIPDVTTSTIAEIIKKGVGDYKTAGIVYGINAQSFLIGDGTAYMLVFRGAGWECDVKVGEIIEITGTVSTYGGAYQFGKDAATYEVVGNEPITYPTPIELTADMIAEYSGTDPILPEYVKVKGTLAISGNYYNLTIDGATLTGSIAYPADDLSAFNGKEIEVEGFVTGVTGSGRYLNLLALNIAEVTGTDDGGTDDGDDESTTTIAEIIEKGVGEYTTVGKVYGINAQSFLIGDGTAYMLVFRGSGWACDIKVGDQIKITGTVSTYGGAYQFGKDAATYEVIATESVTYTDAIELTGAAVDAFSAMDPIVPVLVKVKGTLAISGSYYNLTIDGATLTGSIAYPADDLSAFNGKEIEVEGFVTGVTGSGRYLNLLALNIAEVTGTDDGGTDDGDDESTTTIAEIIEKGVGEYTTVGKVYGINAQSFLIGDGTAYMLVFRGAGWECDVNLADVIKITGTVGMYGGAYQFGKDAATYETVDMETVVYPDSVNLTQSMVDGYEMSDAIIPEFVKLRGTLTISGNYYNLNIDGVQMMGSIAYPNEDLSEFNGKEIEVEGFVTGITGGGKYLNLLSISIIEIFE